VCALLFYYIENQ